jgi:hypothetical protein
MKSSKIALVGNAKPERDYALEIEACDQIIRFGAMPFRGSGTGTRTTIYAVHNLDQPLLRGEPVLQPEDFDDLWINTWFHGYADALNQILWRNNWRDRPFRLLFQEPLGLSKFGIGCASTGQIVIEYLLRWPKALIGDPKPELKLFCFTWQGTTAHQWEQERQRCCALEAVGLLCIIK